METVTYKGNVYQIGKLYHFSDTNDGFKYTKILSSIRKGEDRYHFTDDEGGVWRRIEVIDSSEFGTETPAPIKLIDGAAYMFDHLNYKNEIGLYCASDKDITSSRLCHKVVNCTNIRLMMVKP